MIPIVSMKNYCITAVELLSESVGATITEDGLSPLMHSKTASITCRPNKEKS
ncbi:hypothetical protein GCM10007359_19680 [Rothia aerolata]|uniref:Uncharacterized protein n=1 Tax=Rothia aerolata TaxID=1812262 RepID=A0A917IVM7_9MICC|nr:hypothetical protein GCM10007359_19680 [Rothia aerolata]